LIPLDWALDDLLTHGEFAQVLHAYGVIYVANDPDELASREFVEAMLRRELWKLRDYLLPFGVCLCPPCCVISEDDFQ
jgi:hypothetical protein